MEVFAFIGPPGTELWWWLMKIDVPALLMMES